MEEKESDNNYVALHRLTELMDKESLIELSQRLCREKKGFIKLPFREQCNEMYLYVLEQRFNEIERNRINRLTISELLVESEKDARKLYEEMGEIGDDD